MFGLNVYVLCTITLITGFLIHFSRGAYSKKTSQDLPNLWSFNLFQNLFSLITVLIIFVLTDNINGFSIFSVTVGALMGIVNVITLYASLRAYNEGPFSYTTVVVSLSVLMPTLSGLFYGENISVFQYAGIVMMVFCIVLSPENNNAHEKSSLKWLLWSTLATVTAGMVGIFQKIHQSSAQHSSEMAAFLISCFATSVFLCFICYSTECKKANQKILNFKLHYLQILGGFSNAASHSINIYLVGVLPAVIIFPVVNLIPMIFLILSSVVIFKEKLSVRRWLGVGTGIVSTMLLSGIFN